MTRRAYLPSIMLIALFAALGAGCAGQQKATRPGAAPLAGVEGTVYAPAEGVFVYVYKKGADPHGPAEVILPAPTLADGLFTVNLPPGDYTLVARRRSSTENTGPMLAGDMRSDPVDVRITGRGKVTVRLLMNVKDDTEFRSWQPPKEWTTAIAGTIRDADGNPVEGTRVHVYTYVQMSERPKYVSERTGPDGRYVVFLPKGGTYYLAARNRFGGPPRIGDLYGRYDEGSIDPTGVIVKDGERLEKVDIIVFKVW
jgi:hypothetical protein